MNIFSKIHNFLSDSNKVEAELYWIKKVWYIILLVLSSIYVYKNFNLLVTQCFVCKFDGNSIIFILWILLLIIPFINSIEGYGFKFNKEVVKKTEELNNLGNGVANGVSSQSSLEELKSRYETIIKEHENE